MKHITSWLTIGALLITTGCGSLGVRFGQVFSGNKLGLYPGVRLDAKTIWTAPAKAIGGKPEGILLAPLCLADMPLSTVADACFLASDIKESK